MLEPQSQQIAQDFHIFPGFVATHWTFSYGFSYEPENRWPQNRCFVRGFRQFSLHVTKCHTCHGICTLSPLDAALTLRFPKWACNTTQSEELRPPHKMTMEVSKVQNGSHLLKTTRKYSACHTERLLTRYETCWNVTKCHACHSTRGYATFENLQSDRFCNTPNRHGHNSDLIANRCERLPTVADGCEHKSSVERTRPNPQTPKVKLEPCAVHSGKTKSGMAKSTDDS